jgi:hypothetical protein
MKSLFDAHVLAMSVTASIEPTEIVESHRVDDESVPVPPADRIP